MTDDQAWGDSAKLDLDAGNIGVNYPTDNFPGHAAWLEWPYKPMRPR